MKEAISKTNAWVKVFRINPEFNILRLTFHRKSASKCWIEEIIIASLISFKIYLNTINHFNFKFSIFVAILQVLKFEFQKFRILEIRSFRPMHANVTCTNPLQPYCDPKCIFHFVVCIWCTSWKYQFACMFDHLTNWYSHESSETNLPTAYRLSAVYTRVKHKRNFMV